MRFRTVAELVEIAESEGIPISEVMIRSEMEATGQSRERIVGKMEESLDVMEKAIRSMPCELRCLVTVTRDKGEQW